MAALALLEAHNRHSQQAIKFVAAFMRRHVVGVQGIGAFQACLRSQAKCSCGTQKESRFAQSFGTKFTEKRYEDANSGGASGRVALAFKRVNHELRGGMAHRTSQAESWSRVHDKHLSLF